VGDDNGATVLLHAKSKLGVFWLVAFVTILVFNLNYQPPDKYIFYLPTYLLVTVATGCGVGSLLEWVHRHLVAARRRRYLLPLYLLPASEGQWYSLSLPKTD
jgi:hypothetical protein